MPLTLLVPPEYEKNSVAWNGLSILRTKEENNLEAAIGVVL